MKLSINSILKIVNLIMGIMRRLIDGGMLDELL